MVNSIQEGKKPVSACLSLKARQPAGRKSLEQAGQSLFFQAPPTCRSNTACVYFVQKRFQSESQPQKERRQKDAAAVFRVACSIRRSIRRQDAGRRVRSLQDYNFEKIE